MSPSPAPVIPGILVAHGRLAEELKSTAESIAGPTADLVCLTNDGRTPEALAAEIVTAIGRTPEIPIILVDLYGGSCLAAVQRALRGRNDVPVVAGVNLPLVLDFLQKRGTFEREELLRHLLERGRSGIRRLGEE